MCNGQRVREGKIHDSGETAQQRNLGGSLSRNVAIMHKQTFSQVFIDGLPNNLDCLSAVFPFTYICTSGLHPLRSFTFPLSISFSLCDFADGYDIILINFYADWCRFSQQLKPIFEKAAETMAAEHSVRYCNILQTAYSQSCDYHVTVSIFTCMCYIVLM